MINPLYLGVNVDHVATIRQMRGSSYPCPVHAALAAEHAGADGITMHLREDRRHIQDQDVRLFSQLTQTKLNLEVAATAEMQQLALELKPADVCLVPEKRQELTTEGGLDACAQQAYLTDYCGTLAEAGSRVSLFVDPELVQLEAAVSIGVAAVELHTGTYAEAGEGRAREIELERLRLAAEQAASMGLIVNAGHGLTTHNVKPIAAISYMHELNIGHALVATAVFEGLPASVREMKRLMREARASL